MPLLTPEKYTKFRQAYSYESPACSFTLLQTGELFNTGSFKGIFPHSIPPNYPNGINLRRFENICQEIFKNCSSAFHNKSLTNYHIANLKSVSAAIVHWKMASQGGRAQIKVENLLDKWEDWTGIQLITAYQQRSSSKFRIGGVLIPTATAFMRFLYPEDFGIMDSRVVGNYTQPNSITSLNLRHDGYINNLSQNVKKYYEEYIPLLRAEAEWLNQLGARFKDTDADGKEIMSPFRACDIEMALF